VIGFEIENEEADKTLSHRYRQSAYWTEMLIVGSPRNILTLLTRLRKYHDVLLLNHAAELVILSVRLLRNMHQRRDSCAVAQNTRFLLNAVTFPFWDELKPDKPVD
jgi:hypothetical protein